MGALSSKKFIKLMRKLNFNDTVSIMDLPVLTISEFVDTSFLNMVKPVDTSERTERYICYLTP